MLILNSELVWGATEYIFCLHRKERYSQVVIDVHILSFQSFHLSIYHLGNNVRLFMQITPILDGLIWHNCRQSHHLCLHKKAKNIQVTCSFGRQIKWPPVFVLTFDSGLLWFWIVAIITTVFLWNLNCNLGI